VLLQQVIFNSLNVVVISNNSFNVTRVVATNSNSFDVATTSSGSLAIAISIGSDNKVFFIITTNSTSNNDITFTIATNN
jgi:hypothetical protein